MNKLPGFLTLLIFCFSFTVFSASSQTRWEFGTYEIGGGIIPLFIMDGTSVPVWITPKIMYPLPNGNSFMGAGGILGTVFGKSNSLLGLIYGHTTFGNEDKNFNIGLGYLTYGYTDKGMDKSPAFILGGKFRTGIRSYFQTDNYFFNTNKGITGIISLGGRRMLKKSGIDFGVFIPIGGSVESFIVVPWIGLSIPLGNTTRKF